MRQTIDELRENLKRAAEDKAIHAGRWTRKQECKCSYVENGVGQLRRVPHLDCPRHRLVDGGRA